MIKSNLIEEFWLKLQDELSFPNEYNKKLYHYTTTESLISIIENKELWLTNRSFLNDINENKHYEILLKNQNINPSNELQKEDQYILSLSIEGDLSNQWQYYGKGGYCIVFDREQLIKYLQFTHNSDQFIPALVKYNNDEKINIIEKIKDFVSTNNISVDNADILYIHRILRCIFKEEQSSYEKEYRITFFNNHYKVNYRSNRGYIIPYIKIQRPKEFKDIKVRERDYDKSIRKLLPIKQIIINPNLKDEMAIKGLKMLLKDNGYKLHDEDINGVEIIQSESNTRW